MRCNGKLLLFATHSPHSPKVVPLKPSSALTIDFCANTFQFGDHQMKKSSLALLGFALLLFVALPLHAQDGCLSSPENPTAVLAVVGSAGAFCATVGARIKTRRRPSK